MNPEFQRNLWLEASPRRLAWAGVVLLLIYGATVLVARGAPQGALPVLGGIGAGVFVVCAMLWAARAAANSVLTEIADRTWDYQRLSALDGWSMTWGKLVGAASLAWVCGLSGLLLSLLAGLGRGAPGMVATTLFMLALAVLVQAVSMGAALIGVRKARAEGRAARAGGVLGGLLIGALLLSWLAGSGNFRAGDGGGLQEIFRAQGVVDWGGRLWPAEGFRVVGVSLFAAWAVIGAWRLMRLELQMRPDPRVWPAFLLFLAVFAAGFSVRQGLGAALGAGALAVTICAYAAAFAEPADRVRARQFLSAFRARDWPGTLRFAPATLAPFLLATALGLAAWLAGGGEGGSLAALIAFLLRDLGVIAMARMGQRPERGDFMAILALALLYGVGTVLGQSMGGERGMALFVPLTAWPMISLVSGLVQAGLAWSLLARRVGRYAP